MIRYPSLKLPNILTKYAHDKNKHILLSLHNSLPDHFMVLKFNKSNENGQLILPPIPLPHVSQDFSSMRNSDSGLDSCSTIDRKNECREQHSLLIRFEEKFEIMLKYVQTSHLVFLYFSISFPDFRFSHFDQLSTPKFPV